MFYSGQWKIARPQQFAIVKHFGLRSLTKHSTVGLQLFSDRILARSCFIYRVALCRSWCAICNTSTAATAAFETEHAWKNHQNPIRSTIEEIRKSMLVSTESIVFTCKVSKLDRQHIFNNHQQRIKFMHVQEIWRSVHKEIRTFILYTFMHLLKSMHVHNVGLNVNMM